MTVFTLLHSKDNRDAAYLGFEISGHAMMAEYGSDILCAAISSAAYMAANTVTDVIGAKASAKARDGYISLHINEPDEYTDVVIKGLHLHMEGLKEQYPNHIKITDKEGVF